MCWEVPDNAKGERSFRSVNAQRLNAFRWPFLAYTSG